MTERMYLQKCEGILKRHIAFAEIALKGGKYERLLEASKKLHGGGKALVDGAKEMGVFVSLVNDYSLGVVQIKGLYTSPLLAEAAELKKRINKRLDEMPTPTINSKFSVMREMLMGVQVRTSDGRVRTMIADDVTEIVCKDGKARRYNRRKGQKDKR